MTDEPGGRLPGPDLVAGELRGYRQFELRADGLYPTVHSECGPWDGRLEKARCAAGGDHAVPAASCRCGLYGWYLPGSATVALGPVSAVKSALHKAGLKISDIDVIESNEAFAAQAMGVSKELGLDPAKVNPNGGAVALGHPIGATGAILTIKAMYELHRTNKRYGLITMCIGGGQGIAAVIERL